MPNDNIITPEQDLTLEEITVQLKEAKEGSKTFMELTIKKMAIEKLLDAEALESARLKALEFAKDADEANAKVVVLESRVDPSDEDPPEPKKVEEKVTMVWPYTRGVEGQKRNIFGLVGVCGEDCYYRCQVPASRVENEGKRARKLIIEDKWEVLKDVLGVAKASGIMAPKQK